MSSLSRSTLPQAAGIGLRHPHHQLVLESRPATAWFEVHSENFFSPGGANRRVLETLRQDYPVSLHGVGLSLGSAEGLALAHLEKLANLAAWVQPAAVSDHLCWGAVGGQHLNELLPLPYSREALSTVCANVQRVQERLGRRMLVENVSSYLQFPGGDWSEWDFLVEVARRTGCGILLDVNNIWVSACNHGFDPHTYLQAIPAELVEEIHLAGFETDEEAGFLVDTHSRPVHEPVWALFRAALARLGPKPVLIEWDKDIPEFAVLEGEAARAQGYLDELRQGSDVLAA